MCLIYDMSESEYRAHDAISQSVLKEYAITPAHGRAYELGLRKKDSSGFSFGRALHDAVLLPEKFASDYVVAPDLNKNTNKYKEWAAGFINKNIICAEDFRVIESMVSRLKDNPETNDLLFNGLSEVSMFATLGGIDCKGRADKLPNSSKYNRCIVDLKSCESASKSEFTRSIFKYGYHIQAAFYTRLAAECGEDRPIFVFACIEKSYPHEAACYYLDDEAMEIGGNKVDELLKIYLQCRNDKKWPGYPTEIEAISVPDWVKRMEGVL